MAGMSFFNSIGIAAIGVLYVLQAQPVASQERRGVIPHAPLLKTVLPDTANLSRSLSTKRNTLRAGSTPDTYIRRRSLFFYVVSGSGIWQEEGKAPVTLKAGDSLFVPAGTIHSHWNASTTDRLRFLEFIVAEKDKGRSIPQPPKD